MNKRSYSIRFRFTMIVVLVLVFVIGGIIFVNSTYLEKFTINRKVYRIEETMKAITAYVESDYSDDKLLDVERITRVSGLEIILVRNMSSIPQVIYSSDINETSVGSQMLSYFYGNLPKATEIYQQDENYLIYKAYNDRLGSYQIDCIGLIGDDVGFVLSTPLESIRETVVLSTQFLLILGAGAILFGVIAMYIITSTLTKPIRELSVLSSRMAQLDFNARYEGRSSTELNVLGDSMNQMSDNLQRTIANLQEANTKLEKANTQLEEDLREKERIDERRRQFLSNVSHELKTPIALIQGYSEGLKDGITDDPESMEFYCDVIIDEARKMNTIVKRLLNLDEIETGSVQIVREIFDLSALLEGVAKTNIKLSGEESCECVLDIEENLLVYADEFMIEQVVQNYMSNAYHYVSTPGTVRVYTVRQNQQVRVCVHNTGSHIPDEDISHLWEKFYKVDKARTRSYGGSGIGLSIVKAVLDNHGYSYGVRNTEDGVEFWFEIPTLTPEEIRQIEDEG